MRIFLAGATGAVGRPLLRRLRDQGHEVHALTSRAERASTLAETGATPVVADALDPVAVREALTASKPDVVIHQLTRIPPRIDPRHAARDLHATNRLRDEGTSNLLAGAVAAGARRFIAQSIAFVYAPGPGLRTEADPLHTDCHPSFRSVVGAVASLESQVTGSALEGIVLRYGFFHGPGTIYAEDGTFAADVRRRKIPVPGPAEGWFSFIHVEDAADAAFAALSAPPGIYNVVDDHPIPFGSWLPRYAKSIGAPPPRHIPGFLVRLGAGPYGHYLLRELPGVSNAKAKADLGWKPAHPSWDL